MVRASNWERALEESPATSADEQTNEECKPVEQVRRGRATQCGLNNPWKMGETGEIASGCIV